MTLVPEKGQQPAARSVAAAAKPAPRKTPTKRIHANCECGAKLAVHPDLAGRVAKCPKCGGRIKIPGRPPSRPPAVVESDLDDALAALAGGENLPRPDPAPPPLDQGGYALKPEAAEPPPGGAAPEPMKPSGPAMPCKCCGKQYPPGVKICVECGLDLKTGRPLLMTDDNSLDKAYIYAESILGWLSWLIGVGVYPIASEAFGTRTPWVIRGVGALTVVVSLWFLASWLTEGETVATLNLMLWTGAGDPSAFWPEGVGYHNSQLITHAFLHADPIHLAGNMLFLFVFGSRVNALIGNALTVALYPLLAVAAGLAHMAATANDDLGPMLGASGAVMGLAGMYLVFFPIHKVHMAAWWRWGLLGGFQLHLKIWSTRGLWVVMFYIAFDILYTSIGLEDDVAHWAHLGGFLTGVALAITLMAARLVNARGGDLLTLTLGRAAWAIIGKPNRPGIALP